MKEQGEIWFITYLKFKELPVVVFAEYCFRNGHCIVIYGRTNLRLHVTHCPISKFISCTLCMAVSCTKELYINFICNICTWNWLIIFVQINSETVFACPLPISWGKTVNVFDALTFQYKPGFSLVDHHSSSDFNIVFELFTL